MCEDRKAVMSVNVRLIQHLPNSERSYMQGNNTRDSISQSSTVRSTHGT
jgi:hypothetical protein